MRLIDVDAMNKKLFYKQIGGKNVLISAETAFNMIKIQPTAYDPDRVVAELERKKFIEQETILSDIHQGFNAGLSVAIHVVKGGGVE